MFIATWLEIIKNTSTTWRMEACRAALTGTLHGSEKKRTAFMPESQKQRPEFLKKKKKARVKRNHTARFYSSKAQKATTK